jgi:hypothetical protein
MTESSIPFPLKLFAIIKSKSKNSKSKNKEKNIDSSINFLFPVFKTRIDNINSKLAMSMYFKGYLFYYRIVPI